MMYSNVMFCLSFMMVKALKPDPICFEKFDWGDCGKEPTLVVYYYKPGARCEVASWRGCPTANMFPDQYSCVTACIYSESPKSDGEGSDLEKNKILQDNKSYGKLDYESNYTVDSSDAAKSESEENSSESESKGTDGSASETGGSDSEEKSSADDSTKETNENESAEKLKLEGSDSKSEEGGSKEENTKEDTKETTKEDTKEGTKEETKEETKEATKEATKEEAEGDQSDVVAN